MFRIIEFNSKEGSREIQKDKDGLYQVIESLDYSIIYKSVDDKAELTPFFEDIIIQGLNIIVDNSKNCVIIKQIKLFENSFGFASITIGGEKFTFNVRTTKVKSKEFEDMLYFIWQCNTKSITRFSSRSFIKTGNSRNNLAYSSKFINLIEQFCDCFYANYNAFKRSPYYVVRTIATEENYEPHKVSYKSIDWILQNLDTLDLDISYANHPYAIKITDKYAILNKICVEKGAKNFDIYENNIIIGSFDIIHKKLILFRRRVNTHFKAAIFQSKNSDKVDIRDLLLLPYKEITKEIDCLESRILDLKNKYKLILKNTKSNFSRIKFTPVFAQRRHYNEAFKVIKNIFSEIDLNINDELPICNIKKISKLYELYNLYSIREFLNQYFDFVSDDVFDNDSIPIKAKYKNDNYYVTFFYEPTISKTKGETELINIENQESKFKEPDFVIEIKNRETKETEYHIFDAKYTTEKYILAYIKKCSIKYLLQIGYYNDIYKKPLSLSLLYVDEKSEKLIANDYSPQINYFTSKPGKNDSLMLFLDDVLNKKLNE